MKTMVIYANCQGVALGRVIRENYSGWEVVNINNYEVIGSQTFLPKDLLARADVFVYQPIDKKREAYCTHPDYPNGIMSFLKPGVELISFPYIYLDCFTMYEEGGEIKGKRTIESLRSGAGFSESEAIDVVLRRGVNFRLRRRVRDSLAILKEREQECSVKVSDTIENMLGEGRLFFTQNHPCNRILWRVVDAVTDRIGGDRIPQYRSELMTKPTWPVSPYEIDMAIFGGKPDDGWKEHRADCVRRIYAGNCTKQIHTYALNLLQ